MRKFWILGILRIILDSEYKPLPSCSLLGVVGNKSKNVCAGTLMYVASGAVSALLWGGWHSRLVQGLAMGFFRKICASAESHVRVCASAKNLPFLSAVTVGGISCCKDSAKNLRDARYGALLRNNWAFANVLQSICKIAKIYVLHFLYVRLKYFAILQICTVLRYMVASG